MNLLAKILGKPSNPARELANLGHAQRRDKVKAVARQIRDELGLPPHKALEA